MDSTTVPTNRQRVRRSPDQWRALFDHFERSGQTQEQFCAEQDLGLSTFSRWRQLLREKVPVPQALESDALFVELPQQAPTPAVQPWDVELQLGDGVVLRLRRAAC